MEFIRVPFAINGDLAAIPEDDQPDGSVSMEEGYGFDYQREQGVDPDAKDVERDKQNWLFNLLSKTIQQYQTQGFPDFITSAMNDGAPYSYGFADYVRYDDGDGLAIYYSIAASNTALPTDTTKWARVQYGQFVPGMGMEFHGSTVPSTWLWQNGQTIGNASSGATARANADTLQLFTVLWESYPNTTLPIETSTGAASSRGADAATDFAANKRLPLPDKRGRTGIGKDDMGGAAAANRITTAVSGISGTTMGAAGGDQGVALTANQNGPHSHGAGTLAAAAHNHTLPQRGTGDSGIYPGYATSGSGNSPANTGNTGPLAVTGATGSSGSGDAHLNVQPSIICNFIIKL